MNGPRFEDREDAGKQLAARLARFRGKDPVVLALPRGGVPVGFEIAKSLQAPLDVILVRKIGAPGQPELALGAVVDGPQPELVINEEVRQIFQVPEGYIESEKLRQLAEIERRAKLWLGGRDRVDTAGKTAIVVDDGIATGATVRAALHAIRKTGPARLVLAVPVAPPDTVARLRDEADEIVCLETPAVFWAISTFYRHFPQLDDAQVADILRCAASSAASGTTG